MTKAKKILIVSFTFPPYSGVGGRRWAKFAKYLKRAGHNIEVIAGVSGFDKNSPWIKDIEGIKVEYHNTGYPMYLGINPTNIFEKFMYRMSLLYMKLTTSGNYFDKSAKWKKKLANEIVKRTGELDIVFVTCAPFRMAFDLIPLVKKYPKIKWVVDFRDPWTTNQTAYGFESLSKKRKLFEKEAEKEVVQAYDEVISVAEPMSTYFKSICVDNQKKIKTIPNGYDPEDFPSIKEEKKANSYFTFVFAGTLYDKAIPSFLLFANAVNKLKDKDEQLYQKMKFVFIGTENNKVNKLKHPNVSILPFLPFKEVRSYLYKANAGLLFLTPDIDWSFSTKFTDYIGAQLPILVVSENKSVTGDFCLENGFGDYLDKGRVSNFLDVWNNVSGIKKINESTKKAFNLKEIANDLLK